jgi:hypothetical protein
VTNDVLLIIGIFIAGIGFPALITSFSESRPPKAALIMFALGGGLIAWAAMTQPGGYAISEIPGVFVRVAASFIR